MQIKVVISIVAIIAMVATCSAMGTMHIQSTGSEPYIIVDGQAMKLNPDMTMDINVNAGQHTVTVINPIDQVESQTVTVIDGQMTRAVVNGRFYAGIAGPDAPSDAIMRAVYGAPGQTVDITGQMEAVRQSGVSVIVMDNGQNPGGICDTNGNVLSVVADPAYGTVKTISVTQSGHTTVAQEYQEVSI